MAGFDLVRELWLRRTLRASKTAQGAPPLTFKAKAGRLRNYRIFGNTVNGENVGDLITEGEHAGEYKVAVKVEGKNLLQNTATSQTINGVTFTVNDDGSITCNGTAEQTIFLSINNYIRIDGNVILSGCPDGGGSDSYFLRINSSGTITTRDQGSGANAINPRGMVEIRIVSGYTCNNVTFYPMIRKADIEDDTYEPYHSPITTPIYLPEQIKMVGNEAEYIDYAEQKMHRVRKNLLNIETDIITLGFQYGTVTIFNDSNVKGFFKECEPNTAYTISRKTSSNNRFSIGFSAEEPSNTPTVVLLSYTTPLDTSTTSLTSISPANAKYICCYLSNRGDDITEALEIMLEKNDRATDYEPYITNTELDVTLPALPTLSGTNTLSVGTEVQPSKVKIKYKKG